MKVICLAIDGHDFKEALGIPKEWKIDFISIDKDYNLSNGIIHIYVENDKFVDTPPGNKIPVISPDSHEFRTRVIDIQDAVKMRRQNGWNGEAV